MGDEAIVEKIRQYLSRQIGATDIDPDLDMLASGLVNSLFALELVLFIEKEFNIAITNEDLDYDHFKSLNAIVSFVQSKAEPDN